MKRFLWMFIIPISLTSGTVNIFIYSGPQDWTEVVGSTDTQASVNVSSCAVLQGDATDCYRACINPNGTLSSTPAWVTCP